MSQEPRIQDTQFYDMGSGVSRALVHAGDGTWMAAVRHRGEERVRARIPSYAAALSWSRRTIAKMMQERP